jgi:hypothetical protein
LAPHVLQKRIIIVAAVTKHFQKRTHKFVIEAPTIWDECVKFDKGNDNTLWHDAVMKEMKNVRIAFQILNGEESATPMLIHHVRPAHKYPISPGR